MATKLRTAKIKAAVALMLMLCLAMPLIFSAASAFILATHTHVCHEEEYKESCGDVKECCKICISLYNAKNRITTYYGYLSNIFSTTQKLSMSHSTTEIGFLCEDFSTLVSLKVRLNN
jgi:hypothetical protein